MNIGVILFTAGISYKRYIKAIDDPDNSYELLGVYGAFSKSTKDFDQIRILYNGLNTSLEEISRIENLNTYYGSKLSIVDVQDITPNLYQTTEGWQFHIDFESRGNIAGKVVHLLTNPSINEVKWAVLSAEGKYTQITLTRERFIEVYSEIVKLYEDYILR